MKKIFITLVVVMISTLLLAQSDVYFPDRPGYTYNAKLVGLHRADVEVGFGYNFTNYGEKSNLFYNTTAVRFGMFKHLELRYEIDFGDLSTPSVNSSGVKGMIIGVKAPIIDDLKYFPDVAIIGTVALPNLGKPEFLIPNYAPSFTLVLQKIIGKFALFGNSSVFWDGINLYAKGSASFALYYIPGKFGMFAETYCIYSDRTYPVNVGDCGVIYCITNDLIVDLSGGIDYNVGFDNFFVNCGIGWRLPASL